jgi:peptidoglycan/LPS O-acetylase OafA/YrhL
LFLEWIIKKASDHGRSELKRIDYLDGWRGVAILLVLMDHFFHISWASLGRMGVDVFFVLSGMLMSNILFVKKVPLSIFYKRRISRIVPVFFIFITTLSLSSYLFNLSNEHNNYLYNLFFIRAYFPETPSLWDAGVPVGHLWSLYVEEHCYIILSIITLISCFYKRSYLPILILGIASILIKYFYIRFPDFAPLNSNLRTETVASYLMISAGYFLIKSRVEHLIPSWLPVFTFALALLCYTPYSPHWTAEWTLAPFLLAFTVNHLNIVSEKIKILLSYTPLRLIGIWSFSIYLWQQPFYFYGAKHQYAFEFAGPIFMLASTGVGALSFYLIENPIRKYLNNKW